MKITIPSYSKNYNLSPIKSEKDANKYGLSFDKHDDCDYCLYWGLATTNLHVHKKYGVMETGFFNEASFIDTIGSYQCCSLNTRFAYEQISNFDLEGRKSAKEIINTLAPNKRSKFNPVFGVNEPFEQNVVLACQNQHDRAIGYPSSISKYFEFIELCCKYYGKNLFVKLHPWNSGEKSKPYFEIAKKYNCGIGKCHMSLIKNKDFVISFNSTIAIDCILNDVPYAQYETGTFWNCFGVTYTNQTFPSFVEKIPGAEKLLDFLIYKYCFNKTMPIDKYAKMIKHYASSNDIFPMNDEFCYANNISGE
jgi:hypothetical protein